MLKSQTSVDKNIQQVPSPNESQFEVDVTGNKGTDDGDSMNQKVKVQRKLLDKQQAQSSIQDYKLKRDQQKRKIKTPMRLGYADLITYALTAANQL